MGFNEVLHKADQTLRRELPLLPADFAFRWAGVDFAAQLESREACGADTDAGGDAGGDESAGLYRLTLSSPLGYLPYSAENGAARRMVREVLTGPTGELGARFEVTRQGTIVMTAATDFPAPLNADRLMQALSLSLLHLRPVIMRLRGLLLRGNGVQASNGFQAPNGFQGAGAS